MLFGSFSCIDIFRDKAAIASSSYQRDRHSPHPNTAEIHFLAAASADATE
jgi:hypothetical protein